MIVLVLTTALFTVVTAHCSEKRGGLPRLRSLERPANSTQGGYSLDSSGLWRWIHSTVLGQLPGQNIIELIWHGFS